MVPPISTGKRGAEGEIAHHRGPTKEEERPVHSPLNFPMRMGRRFSSGAQYQNVSGGEATQRTLGGKALRTPRAAGHEGLTTETTHKSLEFLSMREQVHFPRDLEAGQQGVQPWHGSKRRTKS